MIYKYVVTNVDNLTMNFIHTYIYIYNIYKTSLSGILLSILPSRHEIYVSHTHCISKKLS